MVIVYKILTRYDNLNGYEYGNAGYYLDRSKAVLEAHRLFNRRSKKCTITKLIVQEIRVYNDYFDITEIDWINE